MSDDDANVIIQQRDADSVGGWAAPAAVVLCATSGTCTALMAGAAAAVAVFATVKGPEAAIKAAEAATKAAGAVASQAGESRLLTLALNPIPPPRRGVASSQRALAHPEDDPRTRSRLSVLPRITPVFPPTHR